MKTTATARINIDGETEYLDRKIIQSKSGHLAFATESKVKIWLYGKFDAIDGDIVFANPCRLVRWKTGGKMVIAADGENVTVWAKNIERATIEIT